MKTTFIKYTAMTVAALAMTACNLNQDPYSDLPVSKSGKTLDDVNRQVTGVYNGLHDVLYYEWAVTELRSDNARSRANSSNSQDTKLIEQLDQGAITTAHEWVEEYWNACYATIGRANRVLETLEKITWDAERDDEAARYEGEVKFLRAHLYFNLVRLWGPVFKITRETSPQEARLIQRSPVEDIYALIEDDLTYILDNELLPPPSNLSSDDLGRVTAQAAEALLAKVYITHYSVGDEKYSEAGEHLKNVYYNYGSELLANYADIFATDNEMNSEIIFAVRYLSGNVGLGCPFGTLFGPTNNGNSVIMGSPKHYDYPSDNLIRAFKANGTHVGLTVTSSSGSATDYYDADDLRSDVTYRERYYNSTTAAWVVNANGRWCNKFLSPITKEYDGENDWPVIRMGDIALLLAEWMNETAGPSQEALDLVNAVRRRAGIKEYTLAELSDAEAFREAVRTERRLELAFENQRWFDLLRWGTAVETVNSFIENEAFFSAYTYRVNPIAEWQVMLPVPLSVMNINSNVAQNAGY